MTVTSAKAVVIANGATFAVSAAVLCAVRFGAAANAEPGRERGLLRQAREGVSAIARMPGIRTLVLASSGAILFAAMMNVAELLLARSLGAGGAGYSVLVAIFGAGFVAGSLSGAGAVEVPELGRRYLLGILLIGGGLVVAIVPSFPVAALGLAMAGVGNGVNERLICQRVIPDALRARAFAVFDTAGSWAFAVAFVSAGAVLSLTGVRAVLLIAGLGSVAIWALSRVALRGLWEQEPGPEAARPLPPPATAAGRTAYADAASRA